jgi:hypothetical protein
VLVADLKSVHQSSSIYVTIRLVNQAQHSYCVRYKCAFAYMCAPSCQRTGKHQEAAEDIGLVCEVLRDKFDGPSRAAECLLRLPFCLYLHSVSCAPCVQACLCDQTSQCAAPDLACSRLGRNYPGYGQTSEEPS